MKVTAALLAVDTLQLGMLQVLCVCTMCVRVVATVNHVHMILSA